MQFLSVFPILNSLKSQILTYLYETYYQDNKSLICAAIAADPPANPTRSKPFC